MTQLAINTIHTLAIDAVQQAGFGHPVSNGVRSADLHARLMRFDAEHRTA